MDKVKKHRKIRELVSLLLHQFTLIGTLKNVRHYSNVQQGKNTDGKRSCKIAVLNDPNVDFSPF